METIYKIRANELDIHFLESIKALFADNEILISIVPISGSKKTSNTFNKEILDALKNYKSGKVVDLTAKEFDKLSEKLLNS